LQAVWDTGDAVTPLDARLPPAAARQLLDTVRPTRIVGSDGSITKWHDGEIVEDGDALVLATSGTTGDARGVIHTHASIAASATATSARLGIDPTRHSWLACLPLAHIGGLSVVLRALATRTPLIVLPGFDPEVVTNLGRSRKATHVSLVSTALGRVDPSAFETILLGGSAAIEPLPSNVVTTYGLTETGSGVVYDGVPLDGIEIAIGTGHPGEGALGEVLCKGPTLLRAYRDGTVPFISGPDGSGGWFPTGDAGSLDDRGHLSISGRLSEMITTGGEKVYPNVVELVLSTHPQIEEIAIWKRSDPEWGERVVAFVVARDDQNPPSLASLRDWVAQDLAPWYAPKEIELVPSLPRTPSGKVRRSELH
jgi:O-succinylbenzoic acid--CoA ligase